MSIKTQLLGVGGNVYAEAIKYLRRSVTASRVIGGLDKMPEVMLVIAKMGENHMGVDRSMWRPPTSLSPKEAESYPGGILHWWVLDWTKVGDKGYQTPAIALIHEMGHAYQYFFGGFQKEFDKIARGKFGARKRIPAIEADNLRKCETPVVNELNKPWPLEAVRPNYTANVYLPASACRKLGVAQYKVSFNLKSPKQQQTFRAR